MSNEPSPRSDLIGLASVLCAQCQGTGIVVAKRGKGTTCLCISRAIFRACFDRFKVASSGVHLMRPVSVERYVSSGGPRGRAGNGRKNEEYVADFTLVTKRTLNPWEWQLFSWHHLGGADWTVCAPSYTLAGATSFTCATGLSKS